MAGNAQQNASFSIEMLLFANESLTTELLPYDDVIVPDFIYVVVQLEIDPSNQRFYLQVDYCIKLYVIFLVLLPYSPNAFQRNKRCLWILLSVILLCVLLTILLFFAQLLPIMLLLHGAPFVYPNLCNVFLHT